MGLCGRLLSLNASGCLKPSVYIVSIYSVLILMAENTLALVHFHLLITLCLKGNYENKMYSF